jgi:hypothetical protein
MRSGPSSARTRPSRSFATLTPRHYPKAAELRLALSALSFYLPPHTLPNDADFHSDSVVSLRAARIETDGTAAAEWRAALRALESDADATLPGE